MSEHACIVASAQNHARFELCRALSFHIPDCHGARIADNFERYLSGFSPMAFGYEALCETANQCLACLATARLVHALFTDDPDGFYLKNAGQTYVQAFYNEAARAWTLEHSDLESWSQAEFDTMMAESTADAEARWASA